jgi:hypothetical protein
VRGLFAVEKLLVASFQQVPQQAYFLSTDTTRLNSWPELLHTFGGQKYGGD